MTVSCATVVRRTFNKGRLRTKKAKLGKNQRPEEPRLATLFFWTQRNKPCPSTSDNSVSRSQGTRLAGYDDTKATVSAQLASQH